MSIRLTNTWSGKKEEFEPLQQGKVTLYTCGPTVYDYAHIGNFRAYVFEDLLRRFLEHKGYSVSHVMNFTDVDDKTIGGARQEKKELGEFTAAYIQAFNEDLRTLNILPPTFQPRATQEIHSMIPLIEKLIQNGSAYVNEGSVYFRAASFPSYGKLSKRQLGDNLTGARVDVDEYEKEEGADFALWKAAKPDEPSWDSPWGRGRPGWHIECSAMSMKYLGPTLDIHAGGEDLIFPHHENEIAQSEAVTAKQFARYWLHCKHLLVNGEKMSKSKGNFYTLRDLLNRGYEPAAIRYVLLSTHYRSQLNFTLESLKAAKSALRDLKLFFSSVVNHKARLERRFSDQATLLGQKISALIRDFESCLEDDLNISAALASLFSFIGEADSDIKASNISRNEWLTLRVFLGKVDSVLGVVGDQRFEHLGAEVREGILERDELRKQKRFKEADLKRKALEDRGIIIWDEPSGLSGAAC